MQVFIMEKVNVLYSFGKDTWHMAAVSIESLLLSAKDATKITIYCMVEPKTRGFWKIKRIIKSHKKDVQLVWHRVNSKKNPFKDQESSKTNPKAFYRCFAHRVFKNVDKVLYLSVDTLIYRDLSELFNIDISDYVFGAVPDMAPINEANNVLGAYVRDFSGKYLNKGPYYNCGVLLMNLKKVAENENLLFETKVLARYPVQDLLNVAFAGKIKTLPLKYNMAPGVGVPTHFSSAEAAEINAGGHVILDCYYAKFYDKERSNKITYDMFEKCAERIGIKPEVFVKTAKKKELVRKTFIPHIKVRGKTLLFFGMEVK